MRISHFEQATLMITARPAEGREAEWERNVHETTLAVTRFPGHLGTTVLRPSPESEGNYHIIVKFDSVEHREAWRNSPERAACVARLERLESMPRRDVTVSGLETWFEPPETAGHLAVAAPPKWKMAIVVWIAVYAAVLPLLAVLRPRLLVLPPLLASAVGAAASVAMMTWLVMPALSWLLRGWLYPAVERSPSPVKLDVRNPQTGAGSNSG